MLDDLAAIIDRGLAALQRQEWSVAYPLLRRAARETALDCALLEALADAASLLSSVEASKARPNTITPWRPAAFSRQRET